MDRRLQLSQKLKSLLPSDVSFYFQAPPNTGMSYPCVIYALDDVNVQHADNRPYFSQDRYLLTVIDRNPDSTLWRKIMELPTATFVRAYPADNLHHKVINLHF